MARKKKVVKKQPKPVHKTFWMGIAAVFVISFLTVIIASQTGFPLTGKAVQQIAFENAESQIIAGVNGVEGVREVTFTTTTDIKGGKLDINNDETITFPGKAFYKFNAKFTHEDSIGDVTYTLKLEKKVIEGYRQNDIQLHQEGVPILTSIILDEDRHLTLIATTSGFGNFVIGILPKEMAEPEYVKEKAPTPIVEEVKAPVGKAVEEPVEDVEEETGFFSGIGNFFRNLFN
jgi:hypothetical protein